MLWVKSLHVIFMVTWFAGLFYLPRIFVYHAMSNDGIDADTKRKGGKTSGPSDGASSEPSAALPEEARGAQSAIFKVMERKLMIMTHISAVLTTVFGVWLLVQWLGAFLAMGWMHVKLTLVLGLYVYHYACWRLVRAFREDRNTHSHVWFRWFNELPALGLVATVLLVIVKPF